MTYLDQILRAFSITQEPIAWPAPLPVIEVEELEVEYIELSTPNEEESE